MTEDEILMRIAQAMADHHDCHIDSSYAGADAEYSCGIRVPAEVKAELPRFGHHHKAQAVMIALRKVHNEVADETDIDKVRETLNREIATKEATKRLRELEETYREVVARTGATKILPPPPPPREPELTVADAWRRWRNERKR